MGLSLFGKAIAATGAMRLYENGSATGFVWRWWHPLSWVVGPLLFILQGFVTGFPDAWRYRHDLGFRMNPWFVEHPERLKWK
jgi:hypothetical protein